MLHGDTEDYRFPPGFLWGAATSSHQVEGGNRWNDWWSYELAGRLPHRSGAACRHYELYQQDFDLARSLGHNAHRFSVEWSRVEPQEGRWSEAALEHYRDVIVALRARGIEPVVTLHHFTAPAWFLEKGGWLRRAAVAEFARFVRKFARQCGHGVRYWVTLNEPTVYAKHGFMAGDWPPCIRGDWGKALRVLHIMAAAHTAAFAVLHEELGDIAAGIAHSAPWVEPVRPPRVADRFAAGARDLALNDLFFVLLRLVALRLHGDRLPLDFLGLNYYTRSVVSSSGTLLERLLGRECWSEGRGETGPLSDTGWEVYPQGLLQVVQKFHAFGVPLMITENGIATTDEDLRTRFLLDHLRHLAAGMRRGARVLGYFYWSLMDNYEWTLGVEPRFGLAATDFVTQRRSPTPCAKIFAEICRSNRVPCAGHRPACQG